jgi:HEAT repeat protein
LEFIRTNGYVGELVAAPDPATTFAYLSGVLKDSKKGAHARVRAARGLGKLGATSPEVVPVLIGLLREKDEVLRRSAAEALGKIGPAAKGAVPALLEAFEDPSIREAAARALGDVGPEARTAISRLVAALKDANTDTRAEIAGALLKIGPAAEETLVTIVEALRNPQRPPLIDRIPRGALTLNEAALMLRLASYEEPLREAVVRLGRMGPAARAAIPVLRESLKDRDPLLQLDAAAALWNIDPQTAPETVPVLISVLRRRVNQTQVVQTLGNMGTEAKVAVPTLQQLLQRESGEELRRAILEALKKIEGQ